MDASTLVLTVIGSASFGAVAGKFLEAFVLSPITDKYEKRKWLRNSKIEAYTILSEEILSLGAKSFVHDDPWRFGSLAAKTIILLEDDELIKEINEFIQELYKINSGTSKTVESNLPDDFSIKLPDGKIATKKHLERGIALDHMQKEALEITKKLAKDLKDT